MMASVIALTSLRSLRSAVASDACSFRTSSCTLVRPWNKPSNAASTGVVSTKRLPSTSR